jgi:putative ABC transport system permease protein
VTGKLVLENLKHRPMRSLLSILLIGVPVTLILTLVGMTQGILEDSRNRQRGVGADVVIKASESKSVVTFSAASIPAPLVAKVEQQPHVRFAMGVINQSIDLPLVITGIDEAKFKQMTGGFSFDAGGPFQGPDDIVVDRYYASQHQLAIGQKVKLMNHDWRVAGIVEPGKLARLAVPIATLQELNAATGKIGQIYVKVDDPGHIGDVIKELQALLPGYGVFSMTEITAMYSVQNIPAIQEFTVVVVVIGVVIGIAVVALSIYMAVLQRTREIGILKALGASNAFILRVILLEALLIGLGGTLLGIIFSFGAQWLIATLVPASIQMAIAYAWWPRTAVIILATAALGALYPGLSAARHDAIEALAYE